MKAISDGANARAKENRAYRKKIRDKQRAEEEIRTIEEDWKNPDPVGGWITRQSMPSKRQREMECLTLQRWDGWNQNGRGNPKGLNG